MSTSDAINRRALDYPGAVEMIYWTPAIIFEGVLLPPEIGVPYSFKPTIKGGIPPYFVTVNQDLDSVGLSFDGSTGEITGTPTRGLSARTVVLTVTDSTRASTVVVTVGSWSIQPYNPDRELDEEYDMAMDTYSVRRTTGIGNKGKLVAPPEYTARRTIRNIGSVDAELVTSLNADYGTGHPLPAGESFTFDSAGRNTAALYVACAADGGAVSVISY